MRHVVALALVLAMSLVLTGSIHAVVSLNTETVKNAIVFIYGSDDKGEVDTSKQTGTGFLISVPKANDPNQGYVVLVTARHIVDPVWAGCTSRNPTRIYIRVNRAKFDPATNESGVRYFKVDLINQDKPTWFASKDQHADAALLPVPKELASAAVAGEIDIKYINYRNFGNQEEIKKLDIGSDVASAGLVPGLQGVRRNYPIFKFGKIANIPDEMATFKCTKDSFTIPIRIWWLAMNQVGGNSGAPIFFTPLFPPGGDITIGEPRAMIIGLQSLTAEGTDIAGMTPAIYIMQVIADNLPGNADLSVGVPKK